MLQLTFKFLSRLYRFSPVEVILSFILMIALSFFEGMSIVAILPIISLTGIYSGGSSSGLVVFMSRFGLHHLTLIEALFLFIALVSVAAYLERQQTILTTGLQQRFNTYLTTNLYKLLASTNWKYWLNKTKSDINFVISNEISRVTTGCYFLFQFIATICLLIIYLILSFSIEPVLTGIIFVGGGLLFWFLSSLVGKSRKTGMAISQYARELFFGITEHLNGIKEVKTYGMEGSHLDNLVKARLKVENNYLHFTKLQSKIDMFCNIIAAVFISVVFYVAIKLLHFNFASLLLVMLIFARIWPRISSLQTSLQSIVVSIPAFASILDLENEAASNQQQVKPNLERGLTDIEQVEFNEVCFNYTDKSSMALKDISFKFKRGEFIGCIGRSGSGKSTLADLLLGLLTPSKGSILVNGYDLTSVKESWQKLISYVPQDVFLFNASIRENLCWATPNASEEEVWDVLRIVQLSDFVLGLPKQLDTLTGDRGITLSGGERQRLVLARALLRKPQFLILDEATSALDELNEELIQHALEELRGKLSIFVIAHRLSTIKNADKILVIANGQLKQK